MLQNCYLQPPTIKKNNKKLFLVPTIATGNQQQGNQPSELPSQRVLMPL